MKRSREEEGVLFRTPSYFVLHAGAGAGAGGEDEGLRPASAPAHAAHVQCEARDRLVPAAAGPQPPVPNGLVAPLPIVCNEGTCPAPVSP
jgi:hypothetical protein